MGTYTCSNISAGTVRGGAKKDKKTIIYLTNFDYKGPANITHTKCYTAGFCVILLFLLLVHDL